jgi:putative transposase
MPRSRATCAIGLPVSRTSRTAPSRKSASNFLRVSPIAILLKAMSPRYEGKPRTAQQARNLLMDLGEQAHQVKFMIRDRGSNFTSAFDAILADAGIRTVLCSVRTPRMNAIAERWIGGCRRELLDRALIWNQTHLRRILREYETHHNQHRPHRSLSGAAPLKPLPQPVDLEQDRIRRQARVGGLINEYRLVA